MPSSAQREARQREGELNRERARVYAAEQRVKQRLETIRRQERAVEAHEAARIGRAAARTAVTLADRMAAFERDSERDAGELLPDFETAAARLRQEQGRGLDGLAREVYEEVGVRVADVEYQHSQPWPFPASLMAGFRARALDTELTIDETELLSAEWMSRDELRTITPESPVQLPRPDSIARRLIEEWLAEG